MRSLNEMNSERDFNQFYDTLSDVLILNKDDYKSIYVKTNDCATLINDFEVNFGSKKGYRTIYSSKKVIGNVFPIGVNIDLSTVVNSVREENDILIIDLPLGDMVVLSNYRK